jgi:hypothetical protein
MIERFAKARAIEVTRQRVEIGKMFPASST